MDDDSSLIGRRLKQTGGLLLGGAQKQVQDYIGKFESLRGVYDEFLSKMLISYDSAKFDPKFVDKFFGKRKLRFAGIDGTVLKYDVFDLLIFFAGAYPAFGDIEIDDKGESKISYDEKCPSRLH